MFILSTIIVSIPLLSSDILMIFDNIYIRISLLILLIICAYKMQNVSLLLLMAIGILYIERNRRKIRNINKTDISSKYMSVEEEKLPQKTVPVVPIDDSDDVESWFVPTDDQIDDFVPVAESINQKTIFDSVPNGEEAADFYSQKSQN